MRSLTGTLVRSLNGKFNGNLDQKINTNLGNGELHEDAITVHCSIS